MDPDRVVNAAGFGANFTIPTLNIPNEISLINFNCLQGLTSYASTVSPAQSPTSNVYQSTMAAFPSKIDHDLPADDDDRMSKLSIASTVLSLTASIFGQVDAVRENNFRLQREQFNAELRRSIRSN